MPEDLGQGVKETESAAEISYVELYDFILLSGQHFRFCNSDRQIRALSYEARSSNASRRTYESVGITRSAINRDDALSVAVMTISVGDPDFSVIDQVVDDIDNIIGAQFYCRRLYYTQSGDAEDFSRYRFLFRGLITGFSIDSKGTLTMQVSDRWFDWSLSVNRRTFNRMCGFIFKGSRCGYSGGAQFCDKTLIACASFSNSQNFGGFKNIDEISRSGVPFV